MHENADTIYSESDEDIAEEFTDNSCESDGSKDKDSDMSDDSIKIEIEEQIAFEDAKKANLKQLGKGEIVESQNEDFFEPIDNDSELEKQSA